MQLVEEAPGAAAEALGDAVVALLRSYKQAARHPAHATLPLLELAQVLDRGEMRLGELAALRGVGQSVISRQVAELEARGLVVRRADPADGRAGLVRLTPAGCAVLASVADARRRWLDDALASYPDSDVRTAARLVTALADELRHHFALEEGPHA
jgi:DNA-binding MarR family transcriptional regulator